VSSSKIEHPQRFAPLAQRVLAEQIKIVILQSPAALAAPAAIAAVSPLVLWNKVAHVPLLITIFLIYLTLFWGLTFYWRYKRSNPAATDAEQWARESTIRTAAHGCCWGAYSLAIFVPDSIAYQGFAVAFMYGLTAGAVASDGSHYRNFIAFSVPTLAPIILRCFFEGTLASIGVGLAGLIGLLHSLYAARTSYQMTATSIQVRFENMDLVRELETQKETAERLRAEAEAANQSKSRFLAAASHDLRQPVHALGMFVAAADHASSDAERKMILSRIAESVGSLAALFDSLLDVSRLDAGILQPQIKTVGLAPMLRKLTTEYAPEAYGKQLQFRVRCPELTARTDPLLIERILRNLVTNALRYTNSGGILITCRKRGANARVEVWDTGIGIAVEKQTQVFEEFYQIGNPERDRRNGVGLGLAIVKRIAALLQHPLHLKSQIGKGSRFGIDVPLSTAGAKESGELAPVAVDDETVLFGAVVVIIDDEAEVVAALELLLKQWGCVVITADCSAQAYDKLHCDGVAPDLILSDYRLRGDETGIGVIKGLRSTFGEQVPALLVTGDTAVERLRDAAASGLTVLHKPLNAELLKQALIKLLSAE
jgi:two-component system, sensor histidine kinase